LGNARSDEGADFDTEIRLTANAPIVVGHLARGVCDIGMVPIPTRCDEETPSKSRAELNGLKAAQDHDIKLDRSSRSCPMGIEDLRGGQDSPAESRH